MQLNVSAEEVVKVQQEMLAQQSEEIVLLRAAVRQFSQRPDYREGDDPSTESHGAAS